MEISLTIPKSRRMPIYDSKAPTRGPWQPTRLSSIARWSAGDQDLPVGQSREGSGVDPFAPSGGSLRRVWHTGAASTTLICRAHYPGMQADWLSRRRVLCRWHLPARDHPFFELLIQMLAIEPDEHDAQSRRSLSVRPVISGSRSSRESSIRRSSSNAASARHFSNGHVFVDLQRRCGGARPA